MAHVVMGVNWMWQGVAHDASLSCYQKGKQKGDFKTKFFPWLQSCDEQYD